MFLTHFKKLNIFYFCLISLFSVTVAAQPTFTMQFSPDRIGPGSSSKMIFTIDNGSGSIVSSLAFANTLPAGVVFSSPANPLTTCQLDSGATLTAADGGSTLTFSGGIIAGNDVCTVTANVTSSTPGTHMNVSGDLTSTAGNSGNATDDLMVETTRPGFFKSFSQPIVSYRDPVSLVFTIDNSLNGSFIQFVSFSDSLPGGMIVASPPNYSTTCTAAIFEPSAGSDTVSLSSGFLNAGEICTATVDLIAIGTGVLKNETTVLTARNISQDVSSGLAVDSLEIQIDPVIITKDFIDDPTPPGQTATLSFTISNRSRFDSASNINFSDDLSAVLAGLTALGLPASDVCGAGSLLTGTSTISLTGGSLPAEGSCTFNVDVQIPAGTTPGEYLNVSSNISGDQGGTMFSYSPAKSKLFVQPVPILTKEFTDDPVAAGSDVTLQFTIENTSATSSATNIHFMDELTTFLPFPVNAVLPADGFCGPGSHMALISLGIDRQALNVTGANLQPLGMADDSCTFDVVITIPVDMPNGLFTNTTTPVYATADGSEYQGLPAQDDLAVVAAPDFFKEFTDDPVSQGGVVTLEFTLIHSPGAPGDATSITFTDDLNSVISGLTNISGTLNDPCGSGSQLSGNSTLTFTGGTLAPGETCTFSILAQLPAIVTSGSYTNTTSGITANVGGVATAGPAAQDDLQVANITFSKQFMTNPVTAGGTTLLRFTFDNTDNPDSADIVSFSDNLSAMLAGTTAVDAMNNTCGGTLSITGSSDNISYSGGSVAANSSCVIDVNVTVPVAAADGVYVNTTGLTVVTINGNGLALPPARDELEVFSDFIGFTKEFIDDPVSPGDTAILRFTIENLSPVNSISSIAFTDDLDAALSGLQGVGLPMAACGGSIEGVPDASTLDFSGGSLAAGASCIIEVTVQVPAAAPATTVTNTTSVITGLMSGSPVNGAPASDNLVIQSVSFSKSFDGPTTATGAPVLTYTITNNSATSAISNLSFTDDMNAVISGMVATNLPLSNSCGVGSSLSGSSLLTFSNGNLAPSETCMFSVNLSVPVTATAGSYISTSSQLYSSGLPAAEPAVDELVIEPAPLFSKFFAPAAIGTGQTSILTFTIDNTASALAAGSLDFTDNFPAGVNLTSTPLIGNTCGGTLTAMPGAAVVTLTGGSVGAGAVCNIQVEVTSASAGSYLNTTGDLTSTSGNSGPASRTLVVNNPPSFSKAFAPGDIFINGISTLTFTIDNTGSTVDAMALSFTDTFPAGMSVATPSNAVTTCTGGTITANSGENSMSYVSGIVTAMSSCTVTVDVTANLAGNLMNTSGNLSSHLGNSGTASDTLVVNPLPIFSKAFSPDLVAINQVSQLTFTLNNTGSNLNATGINFTDIFPTNLLVATPNGINSTCNGGTITAIEGSGQISYASGSVNAGTTCTISVNTVSSVTGDYANLSSDMISDHGNSGPASDTLTVYDTPLFQKSFVPDTILVNQVSTLTFTLDNTSNVIDATNVSFIDNLPAGMSISNPTNASTTCPAGTLTANSGDTSLSFVSGTIQASASCSVIVDVTANIAGDLVNTSGDMTSDLGNSGPATDTLTVAALPVLTKSYTGGVNVIAGNIIEITFELVNNYSLPVNGISFTDDLDVFISGATATNLPQSDICGSGSSLSGTGIIDFQNGSLAANSSCQFTVLVEVPIDTPEGTYINTTSPLTVDVNGTPTSGGAGSSATMPLFVNGFIPLVPVLDSRLLLILLALAMIVITRKFIGFRP